VTRATAKSTYEGALMTSTWFITGTSSGFGRELTERLLERGDRVAATLRRPERLNDLATQYGDRLWVRELDVTNTEQMREVVDAAFAELGRIDVVVSNAGFGVFGTAEEHTDEQIDGIVATNLVGSIQLVRAVTPLLREQGGGRILQMSSMGGIITFPGFSLYHATKFGIEGFFDAYAPEVAPFGIRTTLIEPGMIRTSFYEAAQHTPQNPAYDGNPALHREGTVHDLSHRDRFAGRPRPARCGRVPGTNHRGGALGRVLGREGP
jgi:NAD(P)-dependent dehydrogenase (short-subunit alcohol dehydrogenase family)